MTKNEKTFGSKKQLVAIGIFGTIALIAVAMWIYQSITGLQVTAMRDLSSWGLYITMFMLFVGLSAGGLIISSAPKVFGLKGFEGISKVAVMSSIVCTILAITFVIVDLGHPERIWHMFVYGQLGSPLMWDMLILTIYLVLSIVYLVCLIKADKKEMSPRTLKGISIGAFIVAVLVHSVTAWIFSLNGARPFWNTALMAPWFVASALVSGLALVLILTIVLRKTGYIQTPNETFQKMGKLLGVFIAVDLFLYFCEALTSIFPGDGAHFDIMMEMIAGPLAIFFWLQVIGGIVAMVLMFTPSMRKNLGHYLLLAS